MQRVNLRRVAVINYAKLDNFSATFSAVRGLSMRKPQLYFLECRHRQKPYSPFRIFPALSSARHSLSLNKLTMHLLCSMRKMYKHSVDARFQLQ